MALAAFGLDLVLPNGTTRYVALGFSADLLGGTFEELTDAGYARAAHAAWTTEVTTEDIRRKNNGAIVFDPITDGVKAVSWWAIFDASIGGNLIAAGPLLNAIGEPEAQDVGAGDQPRFDDGQLRLIATPEDV